MNYLPDGGQMKAADQHTIRDLKIPSIVLMERAARACVDFIGEKDFDLSHICVVCGSGNNGGDGFAVARMLAEKGLKVTVVLAGNPEHFTDEAAYQFSLLEKTEASVVDQFVADEYSIVIDAVIGLGLSRVITGKYAMLLEQMNHSKAIKVAVDIPSGISADTGVVMGIVFQADYTVTFHTAKVGLMLEPGKSYAGMLCVADIGIDTDIFAEDIRVACTLDQSEYIRMLPVRKEDSNKGTYGRLLVIAGSKGMSGAAYLNALSAYRMGAGLVRIYTPEVNRAILQQILPEAIVTSYDSYDEEELIELLSWADVVCVGSGLGTGEDSVRIMHAVMKHVNVPCVVDADGLNILARNLKYLEQIGDKAFVFTPHMKEFSRLTGKSVEEIRMARMDVLREFTEDHGVTCVLKDARTVILSKNGRAYVNLSGTSALAKAGSGDVLAGMIAALLAQGLGCSEAALLGVYLHGCAGECAAEKMGCYSILARDIADAIGKAVMKQGETKI